MRFLYTLPDCKLGVHKTIAWTEQNMVRINTWCGRKSELLYQCWSEW